MFVFSTRHSILLLAFALTACTKFGGNGDLYLGGDDESTVAQVEEALRDTLADLAQATHRIRATTGTDPLAVPARCASGDDDCRHLQELAAAGKYDFVATLLRSDLDGLVPAGPVRLVEDFPSVLDPFGHERSALGATQTTPGSEILLNAKAFRKFPPARLRRKMMGILVHEREHQLTGKRDNEPVGPYTGSQGAQECFGDAGRIMAQYAYSSGLGDLLRGVVSPCTGVASVGVQVVFTNGTVRSSTKPVTTECAMPWVMTSSPTETLACGSDPTASCEAHPTQTVTTARPYPEITSAAGTTVSLWTEDPVWVGASSPALDIHALTACTPGPDAGVCLLAASPARADVAGLTRVRFFNGATASSRSSVPLPAGCANPEVSVQSYTATVECRGGTSTGPCPSAPTKTTQPLVGRAELAEVAVGTVGIELVAQDGVWVGASSPWFNIAYQITCHMP